METQEELRCGFRGDFLGQHDASGHFIFYRCIQRRREGLLSGATRNKFGASDRDLIEQPRSGLHAQFPSLAAPYPRGRRSVHAALRRLRQPRPSAAGSGKFNNMLREYMRPFCPRHIKNLTAFYYGYIFSDRARCSTRSTEARSVGQFRPGQTSAEMSFRP